jgi:SAM-dependent methyltransferase
MKSNEEWIEWGKTDPLYGVASWPGKKKGSSNPWTDEEFYALGSDWDEFSAVWKRASGYSPGTALEIGSGAGRITRRLAETFSRVVATDVSKDILEYAKARIAAQNISWNVSDGAVLPAADSSIDAVFSCHVLQHLPSPAAQLSIFREVHRVLRDGGTFFIHLPLHVFPEVNTRFSNIARRAYGFSLRITSVRDELRRRLMRFGFTPPMRGVSYELVSLLNDLKALGFHELTVSTVLIGSVQSAHSCISGRK